MWGTVMLVNSGLWVIGAVYFFYAFGVGVMTLSWTQFFASVLMMLFLTFTEFVIAIFSE